jgi:hypothetical protein
VYGWSGWEFSLVLNVGGGGLGVYMTGFFLLSYCCAHVDAAFPARLLQVYTVFQHTLM